MSHFGFLLRLRVFAMDSLLKTQNHQFRRQQRTKSKYRYRNNTWCDSITMTESEEVPVSARTGVPLDRTVMAHLFSDDDAKIARGVTYVRRVVALLFLQFTAVAMIISPFCLIDSIKELMRSPYIVMPLCAIAFIGLFLCCYAVAARGEEKWAAAVGLFGGTFFFAVALGAKLSLASWANYALVAVGQATAGFALVLAVLQFDNRGGLQFLRVCGASILCFFVGCLWALVMRESGCSWLVSSTVPLGGWLFVSQLFYNVRKSASHREPDDYLRAVIFILGPPIPEFLIIRKPRSARGRWAAIRAHHHFHTMLKASREEKEGDSLTANDYGAVDSAAV